MSATSSPPTSNAGFVADKADPSRVPLVTAVTVMPEKLESALIAVCSVVATPAAVVSELKSMLLIVVLFNVMEADNSAVMVESVTLRLDISTCSPNAAPLACTTIELALERGDDPDLVFIEKLGEWLRQLAEGRELNDQQMTVLARFVNLLKAEIHDAHANWDDAVKWSHQALCDSS